MKFLLQTDNVSVVEKRIIRHAAALADSNLTFASLNSLQYGNIDPAIPLDATPVGTVEFVSLVMAARSIAIPSHLSYPKCLRNFLGRKIWEAKFGDVQGDLFVKPRYEIKGFTGAMLKEIDSPETIASDSLVWVSEPVKFVSEWRYYVHSGKIVGAGRYEDGEDDAPKPEISTVHAAVAKMAGLSDCPAGYGLDFGVTDDGRTILVEANDGWALGYYKGEVSGMRSVYDGPCSSLGYAKLLYDRWMQLACPSITL